MNCNYCGEPIRDIWSRDKLGFPVHYECRKRGRGGYTAMGLVVIAAILALAIKYLVVG